MKINSSELPVLKMLVEMVIYAADDVKNKVPSACPKNERAEAKRTAREFFESKFFQSVCDILNVSADRIRSEVLSKESTIDRREKNELSELWFKN